jgi:glycine betaine/proline transport system permease protein
MSTTTKKQNYSLFGIVPITPTIIKYIIGVIVFALAMGVSWLIHFLKINQATDFPINFSSPVTNGIDDFVDYLVINYSWMFDWVSDQIKILVGKIRDFLIWVPWPVTILAITFIGWKVATRNVGIGSCIALLLLASFNLWESAMITIAIMSIAVLLSVSIGIPVGILAASNNRFESILKPILDGMQTMPSFVYLIPGIMFFGLGNVAAILATVLYAIPPCIRLTNLGIRQVDIAVVEAGTAFGSNTMQLLTKVQIPMAIPTIMAGINQTVMMALAMVTIAAMVGAGGLGADVLLAMGQLEQGDAVISGLGIVVLAIVIDRISQGYINNRNQTTSIE